ncbi:MAG: nicotinamide-nucleotide amidohydrolase family protein, partial [Deltaproteobacteria bacterium]|nr:nicotinamide-nucleotide amidohydrolase family protein [Deltaproteobacteria bacterium]
LSVPALSLWPQQERHPDMKASLVVTGAEILRGIRQDALIRPLSSMLASRGIEVTEVRIVADHAPDLCKALVDLSSSSDLIIVTGGLGMTPDDTTRLAIEELKTKGRLDTGNDIENPVGSARGIDLVFDAARVLFFPGVVRETLAMFPTVLEEFPVETPATSSVAVFGLRETEIARRLGKIGESCSFLPHDKEVAVIVPKPMEGRVREILGRHALEGEGLAVSVGMILKDRGLTLAAAESCTGGLIGHLITEIPGSSDYFLGSVVSYSNAIKMTMLSVPEEEITGHGAVSEEVARSMLKGVLAATGAHIGVATTGIAGPAGGTMDKPVGTVWIAAGTMQDIITRNLCFTFDRTGNKMIFAKSALFLLREYIYDQDIYRPAHL